MNVSDSEESSCTSQQVLLEEIIEKQLEENANSSAKEPNSVFGTNSSEIIDKIPKYDETPCEEETVTAAKVIERLNRAVKLEQLSGYELIGKNCQPEIEGTIQQILPMYEEKCFKPSKSNEIKNLIYLELSSFECTLEQASGTSLAVYIIFAALSLVIVYRFYKFNQKFITTSITVWDKTMAVYFPSITIIARVLGNYIHFILSFNKILYIDLL
ncbi:MAG: hypothetical protein MHPSP_000917 [Paramarteilia canceri]